MYKIITMRKLNDSVSYMEIEAPFIAKKIKPGQFIILRIDQTGERVPFTVAKTDADKGILTVIFQIVGKTTRKLASLNAGDELLDVVGPLGQPTPLQDYKNVAVIGGGLGCAIAYPLAKSLYDNGAHVEIIAGFRTKDIIILEDELKACCHKLYMCTDDGTYGEKGFVTNILENRIKEGAGYDCVIAVGPLIMMKFVAKLTKPYGIKTIVSMNPIMIDGTGMCGGCRVNVGGETKFACVDGPDFDGHLIDFDSAIKRAATYKKQEREALDHYCKMLEAADKAKTN
jgi:ferredoxin--NADP+ reductase